MSLKPFEVDEMLKALWGAQFRERLTDWESDFVGSITSMWERARHLTPAQEAKLEEIWDGFASGKR